MFKNNGLFALAKNPFRSVFTLIVPRLLFTAAFGLLSAFKKKIDEIFYKKYVGIPKRKNINGFSGNSYGKQQIAFYI